MIREIKAYHCDTIPKEEDIRIAMDIAKSKDIIVNVFFWIEWEGLFKIVIQPDSTFESIKKQLPNGFGVKECTCIDSTKELIEKN